MNQDTSVDAYIVDLTSLLGENELNFSYENYLLQNERNPFSQNTIIRFKISKPTFVSLKIFDAFGKEIKELIRKNISEGNYEITFDGASLPCGIYFYQLATGDFTETKKMVVAK